MKKFYQLCTFLIFILFNSLILEKTYAKTTFKGGILTQSKSLKTVTPKPRNDLNFDLSSFDDSHLSKIINKREAIRFERRIGYGAPLKRVRLHIKKSRKQAIDDVISDLKKYEDVMKWPLWTEKAIPTSFMEQGLRAQKTFCEDGAFLKSLKGVWLEKLSLSDTPQFERLTIFWLNHFSVNFDMYKQKHAFFQHLKFIRQNANKSYLGYLKGILKDPAMITYLNNEKSYAQNPNENLASKLPRKIKFKWIQNNEIGNKIKVKRQKYDSQFNSLNSSFEKLLGDNYIKVFNDLCDSNFCYFAKDKIMYFSDANHLSKYSLKELTRTEKQISNILNSIM